MYITQIFPTAISRITAAKKTIIPRLNRRIYQYPAGMKSNASTVAFKELRLTIRGSVDILDGADGDFTVGVNINPHFVHISASGFSSELHSGHNLVLSDVSVFGSVSNIPPPACKSHVINN